ncbi:FadR/GntR family transcriptional regulator [Microcella alkaliphila]|uniref:GntR family transcriptional regulator n=1 Tax=Microcella alkaliphila TaxID=279828 RepID=A0A0U4WTF5_9MICO|nr:FadR/GntR family transcriptional regulator [Microcella alkaliphila]BAU31191.1 GntR family transcriptional regulator [Microcella alkaliphila]
MTSGSFDASSTSGYTMRGRQAVVIDQVGRDIVSGAVAPGDALPKEADLVEQFGVSRTSVREAMRVLAAKGLVDIRQKVGTRVRPRDQWNVFDTDILRWHHEEGTGDVVMRDLVEVRQIMEPAAARLAAGRATMDDHRRMSAAIDAMAENAHSRDGYAAADVEFHLAVYAASHNALLRQFGNVVADFMKLTFTVQQAATQDDEELVQDAETHAAVYQAIDRGNGEDAAEAMLRVVLDGKNSLIKALGGLREE